MKRNIPHSDEAERCVLGCIILNPVRNMPIVLDAGINQDSFYSPANLVLFSEMQKMHSSGNTIDMVTVGEQLRLSGALDSIGGYSFIEGVIDDVVTDAHLEHYVGIVVELHRKRQIVNHAGHAIEKALTSDSFEDCASYLITEMDRIISSVPDEKTVDEVNANIEKSWDLSGIPSRFSGMRDRFMYEGMVILGAYPSVGKTATLCHETVGWCSMGLKVAGSSLEMTEEKIRERIACSVAGVQMSSLKHGDGRDDVRKALGEIKSWPLVISDAPQTCDRFCAWCRSMKAKGVDLIWLDYLQLFNASRDEWHMPAERMISMWSNKIKATQKAIGIPIVVLSQLSRPAQRDTNSMPPPPTLSSLRYSGSIEQDADSVLLLYKDPELAPAYFLENQVWPEYIDIAKQRNGETGRIKVLFDRPMQRYSDASDSPFSNEGVVAPSKNFDW
jgi:replicative DNA helicase